MSYVKERQHRRWPRAAVTLRARGTDRCIRRHSSSTILNHIDSFSFLVCPRQAHARGLLWFFRRLRNSSSGGRRRACRGDELTSCRTGGPKRPRTTGTAHPAAGFGTRGFPPESCYRLRVAAFSRPDRQGALGASTHDICKNCASRKGARSVRKSGQKPHSSDRRRGGSAPLPATRTRHDRPEQEAPLQRRPV